MTKDRNSIAQARLLIKNVLLSPLKLLSYIASSYAFLLENVKVGLGDYWFDFELEKIRLKKQTISHLQNGRIVKLTLFTPNWICRTKPCSDMQQNKILFYFSNNF